jgi:hypothetical protein
VLFLIWLLFIIRRKLWLKELKFPPVEFEIEKFINNMTDLISVTALHLIW